MKTSEEFVSSYRHKFAGMVLDGATAGLRGEALSVFCRGIMRKIDVELAAIYQAEIAPAPKPNVNGAATPARKGAT